MPYQTNARFQFGIERGVGHACLPSKIESRSGLIKHKGEIETFGVAKFNAECADSVFEYKGWWRPDVADGHWIDMEHPYITCENNYIESVCGPRPLLQEGLIYQASRFSSTVRAVLRSPQHEVSLGLRRLRIRRSTSRPGSRRKTTRTFSCGRRHRGL